LSKKTNSTGNFSTYANAFEEFCATVAKLRDPNEGCPWDLQQTHLTLRKYMIEEAYEAVHAMSEDDHAALCDELGDVLLQVVLNAQIAKDDGHFDISQVIASINAKMRRRHPHVFGSSEERADRGLSSIRAKWAAIKSDEKAAKSKDTQPSGIFNDIPATSPLLQSYEIGKRARQIKFDWMSPMEVLEKLESEIKELREELESGNHQAAAKEMGDVYFTMSQLCRHMSLDPEVIAVDGNLKFLRRFRTLEAIAARENINLLEASQEKLEELWLAAKAQEKNEI